MIHREIIAIMILLNFMLIIFRKTFTKNGKYIESLEFS